jgi:hypothetical protein
VIDDTLFFIPLRNSTFLMTRLTSLIRVSSIVPLAVLQCYPSLPWASQSSASVFGIQTRRGLCEESTVKKSSLSQDEELLKTYETLKTRLQEIERLSGISALMSWYALDLNHNHYNKFTTTTTNSHSKQHCIMNILCLAYHSAL